MQIAVEMTGCAVVEAELVAIMAKVAMKADPAISRWDFVAAMICSEKLRGQSYYHVVGHAVTSAAATH